MRGKARLAGGRARRAGERASGRAGQDPKTNVRILFGFCSKLKHRIYEIDKNTEKTTKSNL